MTEDTPRAAPELWGKWPRSSGQQESFCRKEILELLPGAAEDDESAVSSPLSLFLAVRVCVVGQERDVHSKTGIQASLSSTYSGYESFKHLKLECFSTEPLLTQSAHPVSEVRVVRTMATFPCRSR